MRRSGTAPNVILTGIPRSGTTLVCHLINTLPDSIALHEPMRVHELVVGDHLAATDIVARFFAQTRASLLADGTAPSKHVGRRIPDRHVSDHPSEDGLRRDDSSYGTVSFTKALTPDFLLVLKHPSAFTALLELRTFPSFAIVRNPLAILGSWNSVQMGFRDGHAPIAEQLDPTLHPLQLTKTASTGRSCCSPGSFGSTRTTCPASVCSPTKRSSRPEGVSWPQSLHPPAACGIAAEREPERVV
jgi:hypothetical protein